MCRISILLLFLTFMTVICADDDLTEEYIIPNADNEHKVVPSESDEEYYRHIHSMMDAYRGDTLGGRLFIETNALIDTKYKTWKRNADLINSLLALPKGMNDAGR